MAKRKRRTKKQIAADEAVAEALASSKLAEGTSTPGSETAGADDDDDDVAPTAQIDLKTQDEDSADDGCQVSNETNSTPPCCPPASSDADLETCHAAEESDDTGPVPDTNVVEAEVVKFHAKIGKANKSLKIMACGDKSEGGAYTHYRIVGGDDIGFAHVDLEFVPADTLPALTNEALLAIVLHRLNGFQKGSHADVHTGIAQSKVAEALRSLDTRFNELAAG